MKTKFLALLSVLVLSMSMLVGCGSKSSSNDEEIAAAIVAAMFKK